MDERQVAACREQLETLSRQHPDDPVWRELIVDLDAARNHQPPARIAHCACCGRGFESRGAVLCDPCSRLYAAHDAGSIRTCQCGHVPQSPVVFRFQGAGGPILCGTACVRRHYRAQFPVDLARGTP